jgi:hypothetical protein
LNFSRRMRRRSRKCQRGRDCRSSAEFPKSHQKSSLGPSSTGLRLAAPDDADMTV